MVLFPNACSWTKLGYFPTLFVLGTEQSGTFIIQELRKVRIATLRKGPLIVKILLNSDFYLINQLIWL